MTTASVRGADTRRMREVLTRRERQIIACVVNGYSNAEIARRLKVREQTIKNALTVIYEKLGVSTRLQLAVYALRHGLAK